MVQSYNDPAVPLLTTPPLGGFGMSASKKFSSGARSASALLPKLVVPGSGIAASSSAATAAAAAAAAGTNIGSGDKDAKKKKKKKAQVTYLNVHAGLSVGVMAGLDVGAHDRFEVSDPLFCFCVVERFLFKLLW
jgi:hypothetical protein